MKHLPHDSFTPDVVELSTAKRGKSRDSMLLSAGLEIEGRAGQHQVRVRNLSPGGLMAEFDRPVAIGTAVKIDLRGIGKVGGKVAWATQGRIGVSLDREIDPAAARKPVVAKVEPATLDKPIKPILR
ncbi:MAG: PilZ domain-containing protein [Sphingomonas sp.]|uniref:PilZ domain-containing protein n=1 Tax=Sphingomonas sp. TaxID=28214 RepID=UPI001ACB08D3|nr:PilZ domain-containing protein [Sphingomonas sp.]MBN8807554.1 PilZ domain-containing protein [Sphingomonas sp.]